MLLCRLTTMPTTSSSNYARYVQCKQAQLRTRNSFLLLSSRRCSINLFSILDLFLALLWALLNMRVKPIPCLLSFVFIFSLLQARDGRIQTLQKLVTYFEQQQVRVTCGVSSNSKCVFLVVLQSHALYFWNGWKGSVISATGKKSYFSSIEWWINQDRHVHSLIQLYIHKI